MGLCDSQSYYDSSALMPQVTPGWLESNKCFLDRNPRIWACISSTVSTVIHVPRTIKEIITDLMSHSQFHNTSVYTETCMA